MIDIFIEKPIKNVIEVKTKNLKELCLNSDIIVCAVGKPKTITEDMVKDGVVIIDVGINRVDNKLYEKLHDVVLFEFLKLADFK